MWTHDPKGAVPGPPARAIRVARVVGRLPAARLAGRKGDLAAEPLEQRDGTLANARLEQVDEAGDEQLDAHVTTKATENAAGFLAAGAKARCLQPLRASRRRTRDLRQWPDAGL